MYAVMVEPVDIDPTDRDEIGEEDDVWGDYLMDDLDIRFNKLRRFNKDLENASHEEYCDITLEIDKVKDDTIELVASQMYDRITKLINDRSKRLGIKGGANIEEPIRDHNSVDLDDNGNLNFTYKNKVINLGNIKEGLKIPSTIIKEQEILRTLYLTPDP